MDVSARIDRLRRGITNRCPRCGDGPILKSLFARHDACPHCKMDYNREDGFYSGAMAINYALVCAFYLFPMLLVWWVGWLPGRATIVLCFLGAALMPILTYRYSQCLWLALYYFLVSEDLERMELKEP